MIVDAGIVDAEVEERDWLPAAKYVLSSGPRISNVSYRTFSLFLNRDETDGPLACKASQVRKYDHTSSK